MLRASLSYTISSLNTVGPWTRVTNAARIAKDTSANPARHKKAVLDDGSRRSIMRQDVSPAVSAVPRCVGASAVVIAVRYE